MKCRVVYQKANSRINGYENFALDEIGLVVTRDKIRERWGNPYCRKDVIQLERVGVTPIVVNLGKSQLGWFGHVWVEKTCTFCSN